jgi:elongation factor P--beta-lysine ligase
MILNRELYVVKTERHRPELKMSEWDVLLREEHNELEEAQRVVRLVLDKAGIDENDLERLVLCTGERWMELDDDVMSATNFVFDN